MQGRASDWRPGDRGPSDDARASSGDGSGLFYLSGTRIFSMALRSASDLRFDAPQAVGTGIILTATSRTMRVSRRDTTRPCPLRPGER